MELERDGEWRETENGDTGESLKSEGNCNVFYIVLTTQITEQIVQQGAHFLIPYVTRQVQ